MLLMHVQLCVIVHLHVLFCLFLCVCYPGWIQGKPEALAHKKLQLMSSSAAVQLSLILTCTTNTG